MHLYTQTEWEGSSVGHLHLKWTDNGGGGELKAGGQLKRQRGEVVGHRSEVGGGVITVPWPPVTHVCFRFLLLWKKQSGEIVLKIIFTEQGEVVTYQHQTKRERLNHAVKRVSAFYVSKNVCAGGLFGECVSLFSHWNRLWSDFNKSLIFLWFLKPFHCESWDCIQVCGNCFVFVGECLSCVMWCKSTKQ